MHDTRERKPAFLFLQILTVFAHARKQCVDCDKIALSRFFEVCMRLNKSQIAVITVLNVMIAALVATIFLLPSIAASGGGGGGKGDTPVVTPPQEHVKLRDPIAGKVPEISRETRLMGTGDETVVAVYFMDGVAYIFGNATVGDLDFDDYGGFLCRVAANGKISGFTYFDGRLTAVGIVEHGFAAAAASDGEAVIYVVGYDGEAKKAATLDGAAVDIIPISAYRTAVVTKPNDNAFKLTEYASAIGTEWAAEHNTHISSGYTLDYFGCYRLGNEYILTARAYSLPRYDSIVFYTFEAGGDASAHFYGGSGDSMLQPYAVQPYSNGYILLGRRDGVAAIVTVDYSFMSYRRDLLGFSFESAELLYCGGKYYACFVRADGTTVYELDERLDRRAVATAKDIDLDCAIQSGGTLLAGKTSDSEAKLASADGERVLSLEISDCVFYGGCRNADGKTVLVLSATGGKALSEPSGGRDVYVVAVGV